MSPDDHVSNSPVAVALHAESPGTHTARYPASYSAAGSRPTHGKACSTNAVKKVLPIGFFLFANLGI